MKLTVFGATGGIGTQLIREGLARGHAMTAVARRPVDLGCDVVVAGLDDAEALAEAVAGRDAVLSALGMRLPEMRARRKQDANARSTVQADGARAQAAAMLATGVRRIVSVDAAGRVADEGDGAITRTLVKPLLQRLLREGFEDLAEAEKILRASTLDWTLIAPPRLTDGPHRPYRTVMDVNVRGGRTLSRTDVADAMLHALEEPTWIHRRINVAY
ncbi:NAD(P)-dependent oxidoreductase [Dactylosporangium sp. NPDC048998]|uniref:NAD(P)-dependent oxidoreductase n=1 Tax=Dactylosporangium sp. NPDC048998 TaxID=3363976 RepID=UPI0037101CD7